MSLPPPGGNGLDCYCTIRSHETDASDVSAAIKCGAEVAGNPLQLAPTPEAAPRGYCWQSRGEHSADQKNGPGTWRGARGREGLLGGAMTGFHPQ